MNNYKMVAKCSAGNWAASCEVGCYCVVNAKDPDDCFCDCEPVPQPANRRGKKPRNIILKGGKEIPFNKYRSRLKVKPNARYDICAHNMSITTIAQSLDKLLPNRILIPANKLTKKVNLSLKNKTFRQIVVASGLALKS
jgi:hypothetical protein